MRILAFSDLHCDRTAAQLVIDTGEKADVVVGAGDFGIRGERSTELLELFDVLSAPLVLVCGNHDSRSALTSFCTKTENIHLLDGSSLTLKGVTFFGLGGEIPSRSTEPWNESMLEEDASAILTTAVEHQVLLTHTPPFGYCDLQRTGVHEGSRAIAEAVTRHQPRLCLCGHIHHAWGSVEQLGQTTVHNIGPEPVWYEV